MNPYVDLDESGFSPEEFEDVKRCLETLLSIQAGAQPLNRELGINYDGVIGFPMNVAENMLSLEIIEKVNIYEPRVEVESITFKAGSDGQLLPHIRFVKKEG